MFIIDERPLGQSLRQFASQLEHVSPQLVAIFRENFKGDQPPEFYAGLVTGLAAAYNVAVVAKMPHQLGSLLAFVADQVEKKELV